MNRTLPMDADKIFYALDGQKQGPVSPEILRRFYSEGKIKLTTLVWFKGLSDWTEAGKISGLLADDCPPVPTGFVAPTLGTSRSWQEFWDKQNLRLEQNVVPYILVSSGMAIVTHIILKGLGGYYVATVVGVMGVLQACSLNLWLLLLLSLVHYGAALVGTYASIQALRKNLYHPAVAWSGAIINGGPMLMAFLRSL